MMFQHLCLLQDLEPDKGIHEQCTVHYWAHGKDLSAFFIVLVPLKRRNKHHRNDTEVTGQQQIMHPLREPCPGYGLWGKLGLLKEPQAHKKGANYFWCHFGPCAESHLKWLNTQPVTENMKRLHYSCFPLPKIFCFSQGSVESKVKTSIL